MIRMMLVLALLLAAWAPAGAEEGQPADSTGWKKAADLSFNVSQSSYNDAWTGSESAAAAFTFLGNLKAEKQLSPKFNTRNTLNLNYGMTHSQVRDEEGKHHWVSPLKSSDRIFFESLLRMTLGIVVDPYASFTFESQFYNPYDDPADGLPTKVRRYIDPMVLNEAAGVGRTFIKSDRAELLSRVGLSVREHISKDVLSVEPERTETNTLTDGGIEWVTDYTQTLSSTLKYVTKLRTFKALFNSKSDEWEGQPYEDYWKTVDVAWENTLSASVTKYVQVSLFAELLYDKEIEVRGRFREVLGLGLTYKLF